MGITEAYSDEALQRGAKTLPASDAGFEAKARQRLDQLTKPQGSLGRLEDIAAWMCGWQQTLVPRARQAHTLVFAGSHGVVAQGVSAYPAEVTTQMVANFNAGGAAINTLCDAIPSTLTVVPLVPETPTQDFTRAPAMSRQECAEAFAAGMRAVPEQCDLLVLGEMGIGNTTAAAALSYALCGGKAEDWTGAGTGLDKEAIKHKAEVVERAVTLHKNAIRGPLSMLRHVGGRELAALAGAVWQARLRRVPVILDGYVVTAAVAPLCMNGHHVLDHCIAGHVSTEPGHQRLLAWLRKEPLLDLKMRLGEGSGAQLAVAIVRGALAAFNDMATFDSASVSKRQAS